ncbi:MAG: amidohydrolase family protein [Myxococcales bacterium]|nr:amidohydrolase family protein [Myxococcales bacterium]
MSALVTTWAAVVALVGATVHPGDGPALEGATVVIDGERVTAVGVGLTPPAGATVIDVQGKVITPGLIDAWTGLGAAEIWGVPESVDLDAGGDDPVRAAFRVVDALNPRSPTLAIQRAHGVTAVVSAPGGGLIAGQAAAIDLNGRVLRPSVAMAARFGGGEHASRGEALLRLRELLDDTRTYAAKKRDFEGARLRRLAASRLDLEALLPVVRGELPLAVDVHRAADIEALLRFASEQQVKLIVVGGTEAWLVADALAAAKVPVVLDPSANLPGDFDRIHARADAAAKLAAAGVPIALSTFSTHNVRKLRQWAGNAVRAGLPHADALRAVTTTPATLAGLTDRGRVAPGQVADLVVWSGDPFELSTRAEQVWISGAQAPEGHRQRALFERYRTVPPPY